MAYTTEGERVDEDPELLELRRRKLQEMMTSMSDNGTDTSDWPSMPVEITDDNIEEMSGKYPHLVVDCWAEWCGPCRMLGPTIEELAGELQGKVVFGKLNTDFNRNLPRKYGIMSIPTILFYKDGEVVGKTVGALPKEYILEAIEQAFGEMN
ncbi:MAG: thioredoxin [Thermoplasmata archaeon]|nr:MAG: thioredoxin [Thermoplasmata archaeon]